MSPLGGEADIIGSLSDYAFDDWTDWVPVMSAFGGKADIFSHK